MNKNEILKKVIAKLEESEEKIVVNQNQIKLNDFVEQVKELKNPMKIKEIVIQFDDVNNPEEEQKPRLELLNTLKKEGVFKKFGQIEGGRRNVVEISNSRMENSLQI